MSTGSSSRTSRRRPTPRKPSRRRSRSSRTTPASTTARSRGRRVNRPTRPTDHLRQRLRWSAEASGEGGRSASTTSDERRRLTTDQRLPTTDYRLVRCSLRVTMPGRMEFDLGFGPAARPRDDDEPMRLLVLGDFSGRPAGERPPLASRPTLQVDIDTVDQAMRRLAPRVTLSSGEIQFQQLDDFHPDRLFERLELFQALRHARANPPVGPDETVGRLLGKTAEPPSAAARVPANPIDALIRGIVAPYVVKDTGGQSAAYAAAVDHAIAEQMRTLLHDPAFQSLEAAWRGVHWLISSLELDEQLQLFLLDVTRDEILADIVNAQGRLQETGLHRILVDRWRNVPGEVGWSALVALMAFGSSATDAGLL